MAVLCYDPTVSTFVAVTRSERSLCEIQIHTTKNMSLAHIQEAYLILMCKAITLFRVVIVTEGSYDFDHIRKIYPISRIFLNRHGKLIADRHLLVYDLRMHRLISPIHTTIDPFLLHFLPLHCQRLAVVSPLGQLQLVDTVELSKPRICMYQVSSIPFFTFRMKSPTTC